MDLEFRDDIIVLKDKTVNELDEFVLDFISIVEPHAGYCLMSGYVAILFGRARGTEDVDMFIGEMDRDTFSALHGDCGASGFEFINPEDEDGLYEMLREGLAIRAARKGSIIPNIEMKYPRGTLGPETFEGRRKIGFRDKIIHTSPLELQIAYKYYLGSDKDLEDARYLTGIFKEHLDQDKIEEYRNVLDANGDAHGQ